MNQLARVFAASMNDPTFVPAEDGPPVEWAVATGLTDYRDAVAFMEARASDIRSGAAAELVWLVEHPAIYTAGTGAKQKDLLLPARLPVFQSGRGGQYTYHGPGQRVAYVMLDLTRRRRDVRAFILALEEWIIRTLANFGIAGERRDDRVGVWVRRHDKPLLSDGSMAEDKIAAIGVRLRRWVSLHGISINVDPALENYRGIVACGISDHGMTSIVELGHQVGIAEVDAALKAEFSHVFGHGPRRVQRP
jgi:lipoyl(octanoyl) transferase